MSLFGFGKKNENKKDAVVTAGEAKAAAAKRKTVAERKQKVISEKKVENRKAIVPAGTFSGNTEAIIRPHITEKAGALSSLGVYTFQVTKNSNKNAIAAAVKALYKVTPVKISIVNLPMRNVFVRGRWGKVSGVRKALVTVKKGDKIDFV